MSEGTLVTVMMRLVRSAFFHPAVAVHVFLSSDRIVQLNSRFVFVTAGNRTHGQRKVERFCTIDVYVVFPVAVLTVDLMKLRCLYY